MTTPQPPDAERAEPSIIRIGTGPDGKAFVIYLRDGTKINVGRDQRTRGPAWLEVTNTPKISAADSLGATGGAEQK